MRDDSHKLVGRHVFEEAKNCKWKSVLRWLLNPTKKQKIQKVPKFETSKRQVSLKETHDNIGCARESLAHD